MGEIGKKGMRPLTIALLGGTGQEGPGLALRWALAGYPIIIGSRQAEKAEKTASDLNSELGIDTIRGLQNNEAARQADISVLTVVFSAHKAVVESLREDLNGKILVDATARVDFRDPKPPPPPSAARLAQNILGAEVRVVAAFQNVPAHTLRKKLGQQLHTDVLVCADDIDAANIVIQLANGGQMRAYYAGNLDNAIVVEGLTALLIGINKHYGIRTASIGVSGLPTEGN
ncbi:MAG: NADPH-dependent F420 reductase [Anaerolineales bacterium]|nr:NADPH-dependent F420 reductase [Anaerolineales bacterium]